MSEGIKCPVTWPIASSRAPTFVLLTTLASAQLISFLSRRYLASAWNGFNAVTRRSGAGYVQFYVLGTSKKFRN